MSRLLSFCRTVFLAGDVLLAAVLGEVQEFIKRSQLPVGIPITVDSVKLFGNNHPEVSGCITFTNGWSFFYDPGGVNTFDSPHSVLGVFLWHARIEGKNKLTTDQAVVIGREFVRRLGVDLESVFVDMPPEIHIERGWNRLEWVNLSWMNPTMRDEPSIELQISLATGEITKGFLLNDNFRSRPVPLVEGYNGAGLRLDKAKEQSSETATELKGRPKAMIPASLPAIEKEIAGLHLNFAGQVSTNSIAQVQWATPEDAGGAKDVPGPEAWTAFIHFTNHWRFDLVHGEIRGFASPDSFFFRRGIKVKNYLGKPRISQRGAQSVVEEALKAIGHSKTAFWVHGHKPSEVGKPRLPASVSVPRIWLEWAGETKTGDLISVQAEVDTETKSLKAITVLD